jgi:hypothetical protein
MGHMRIKKPKIEKIMKAPKIKKVAKTKKLKKPEHFGDTFEL